MIILKNGTFIDWETLEFRNTNILVEPGEEGKISFTDQLDVKPDDQVIDCKGRLIMKSFVNGHHHVYSALARGMNPPVKTPENFPEILKYIWWNLDRSLDLEMIRSSALVTAISCAKNGVGFVIDHHASPNAVSGCLETIAQAFDEVGVNHLLCYEISDRDGIEIAKNGLNETAEYLSHRQGLVGLHASFTVGKETLFQAVELAEQTGSGIHVHTAEDKSDEENCEKYFHERIIERFAKTGVLQFPGTILAHCLHLDRNERSLVEKSPAWVVQNTESNLNNKVGHFSANGLGKRIMLGTDGMHSDMLRSAKASFFSGQNYEDIDYPETYRRFRNAHHYLESNGFKGDGENNLVVLNYDSPTPVSKNNFLSHFLFGIESRHVEHVLISGKVVVKNGMVTTVDEEKILEEARNQALRLWEKMSG